MKISAIATYARRHTGAVLIDAAWMLFVLWFAANCAGRWRAQGATPGTIPGLGAMAILLFTAFWMPVRNVPAIIRLADRRRREELAMTFVEPHGYLWLKLKWTMLRLPVLAILICAPMLAMAAIRIHAIEGNRFIPIPQIWFILVSALMVGAIAQLGSAMFFLLLFRWFCRSPREHWMAPAASILVALGTFIYTFGYLLLCETIERRAHVADTTITPIVFLTAATLTSILVRLAWRRCWKKYFVFE